MNFWESEAYFSILKSRLNYIVISQSEVSVFKIRIIKMIRIYQIYRALRKIFGLEIYTDLCYLINRSVSKLETVKVLDIGGGIGENYYELIPLKFKRVKYYVHDSYKLFARGEKFRLKNMKEYDAITFVENIDSYIFQFDLLLLNGSLQYLKDIVTTVNQLRVKPKHVILDRALLSTNSFTAKQVNNGGYITEYNVYSEKDLISKFALLGYSLKRSGGRRTHKIAFDEDSVTGYYKAMHFALRPINNYCL